MSEIIDADFAETPEEYTIKTNSIKESEDLRIIVGVDPSIASTGVYYFIIEDNHIIDYDGVVLKGVLNNSKIIMPRLQVISDKVGDLLSGLSIKFPQASITVISEAPISTAHASNQLTSLRDLLLNTYSNLDIDCLLVPPITVKSFAGACADLKKFSTKDKQVIKDSYNKLRSLSLLINESGDKDFEEQVVFPEFDDNLPDDLYDAFFIGLFGVIINNNFDNEYKKYFSEEMLKNKSNLSEKLTKVRDLLLVTTHLKTTDVIKNLSVIDKSAYEKVYKFVKEHYLEYYYPFKNIRLIMELIHLYKVSTRFGWTGSELKMLESLFKTIGLRITSGFDLEKQFIILSKKSKKFQTYEIHDIDSLKESDISLKGKKEKSEKE